MFTQHNFLTTHSKECVKILAVSLVLVLLIFLFKPMLSVSFQRVVNAKQQLANLENDLRRLVARDLTREHSKKDLSLFTHQHLFKHNFLQLLVVNHVKLESIDQTDIANQYRVRIYGQYTELLELLSALFMQPNFVWLSFKMYPGNMINKRLEIKCIGTAHVFF